MKNLKKETDLNPNFIGENRINLVTALPEKYFSHHKRILRYIVTIIYISPFLILAFIIDFIYLNLTGIVT